MEPQPNDPRLQEVHAAILAGQKIEAIKLWRELTGAGLAEAKETIERLTAEARAKTPEKFTAPAPASLPKGCAIIMVLIAIAIAVGILAVALLGGR